MEQRERARMFLLSLLVVSDVLGRELQRGSRWGNCSSSPRAAQCLRWGCVALWEGWGQHRAMRGVWGQETGVFIEPEHSDLELISPGAGCVHACWGRDVKAISLSKTMLPSSASFRSGAVSPNVLS